MKKTRWSIIFNIIFVAISLGLATYFCISENGLADLLRSAHDFNKIWLVIGVIAYLTNILIDIILIFNFVKQSVKKYRFKDAIKTSMIGQFFSAVTPGASGGQPMQLYTMTKQGLDIGTSTSVLIQKFLVYQTTITLYSVIAIILKIDFLINNINGFMWVMAIFGFLTQSTIIVVLLMFSHSRKLTEKIIKFIFNLLAKVHIIKDPESKIDSLESQLLSFNNSNKQLFKDKKLLIKSYAYTVVQLTLMFVVPYCIYRSFNLYGAGVFDMILSQAFVSMTSSFIPLPGASGASEGSFYVFFSMFFTSATIKSAILLWRIITYYFIILISAPFSGFVKKTKENVC